MPFRPILLAGVLATLAPAFAFAAPADGSTPNARPVMVTSGERDTGFRDLAECEAAIGLTRTGTTIDRPVITAGSRFNRAQGNISSCVIVDGEYLIMVMPPA